LNLWRRSLADRDSLLLSLRGLCGERSSGRQAPGHYTWPPRFLLLFSFFLLVLWAGDSSLLAQDSGRAEYKAGKVYRIGFLGGGSASGYAPHVAALRLGLRDHGYLEGKNVTLAFRWAEGKYDRLPALAAELIRLNVDIIVTQGTPAALVAKQATTTVPIVMAIVGNPEETGIVTSWPDRAGTLPARRSSTPRSTPSGWRS
jgi:hypothetical protein